MDFEFRFTKDGSVGLYNFEVDDIYHSSYGAKTEAQEKFISPLNFGVNFLNKKHLKVLDICYGIGYNTKAFLEHLRHVGYFGSVNIDILEYDKRLVSISPFIKDGFYKLSPEVSYILFDNLNDFIFDDETLSLFLDKKNKAYFVPFYLNYIKKIIAKGSISNIRHKKNRFLHNIYYQCISPRLKKPFKRLNNKNITITPYIDDARKSVLKLKEGYDIVFLDAFTPAKLPTLWSYDFLKKIYELMNNNSMLLTYSNSAAIRHALLDIGFFVGKLYDKNKRCCGTVASNNPKMITTPLDEYDIGLMQTNAGVYFRDKNLNLSANEILDELALRKATLNLESSSSYIKKYKNSRSILNE